MRISDWSSDVCSADLRGRWPRAAHLAPHRRAPRAGRHLAGPGAAAGAAAGHHRRAPAAPGPGGADGDRAAADAAVAGGVRVHDPARSEEHTSELQSLMRISYAVFCLTKNNTPITRTQQLYIH